MTDERITYQHQPDGTFLGSNGKTYKQMLDATFVETTPPISIFTTMSKVYLSPHSDGDVVAVNSGATITIKTTTTDSTTRFEVDETIQDITDGVEPSVTIVVKITSRDANTKIETSSMQSDASLLIETKGSDETVDGKLITTITTRVWKPGAQEEAFVSTETSDPFVYTEPTYRYVILRHDLIDGLLHGNPGGDNNLTCQEMYSLFNITCVKLSEGLYQTLKPGWVKEKVIEIDGDTAFYGCTFFGEIRSVAKVWEARTSWYGEKVPTEITPDIVEKILVVMKSFAIETIQYEFERRFLTMRDASELEVASWQVQKEEARAFLANPTANTPFLDFLAQEKNTDKTYIANKVLENAEAFHVKLAELLIQEHKLIDQFNDCTSVWDINILYEDYFGIALPVKQAIELGRTISADEWTRKPEWRVKGNGYYF